MTRRTRRPLIVLWLFASTGAFALAAACGDDDAAPGGIDAGSEGSASQDANAGDAASTLDAARDVGASDAGTDAKPITANIVFVTSAGTNGAFGGLDAGDDLCQAAATDAGLSGTYVAYLSTANVDAIDRVSGSRGWVRPDGLPVVDTPADLAAGRLVYPADMTASKEIPSTFVIAWTGTGDDGKKQNDRCADWTSDAGTGGLGSPGAVDTEFSSWGGGSCSTSYVLVCMGVGKSEIVSAPAPTPGRKVFVTGAVFTVGGGVAAADALCQAEADAAGFAGSFGALLATDGATAASRFDAGGAPWVRIDGLPLSLTSQSFLEQTSFGIPILFGPDGGRNAGTVAYWRGAKDPTTPGTTATTCANWTDAGGSATMGVGLNHHRWGTLNGADCLGQYDPGHLVCLER